MNGQINLGMVWKENKHVLNIFACVSNYIHYVGTQSRNIAEHLNIITVFCFKSMVEKINQT